MKLRQLLVVIDPTQPEQPALQTFSLRSSERVFNAPVFHQEGRRW
ncbi:MAG: hypothetical protein V4812_21950 [Pseudomonadota bacterium]